MKAETLIAHDDGSGNSHSIVFVNGFPLSRVMWRPIIEPLQEQVRCISYDLRGFAENRGVDGVVPIERHVDDLLDLIGRFKLIRPILCGHSFGGLIALRAAAKDTDRIGGLVVCGAHAKHPTDDERLFWAKRIATVDQRGVKFFVSDHLQRCFAQNTIDQPGSLYDTLVDDACNEAPAAIKAAMLAMMGRTDTLRNLEEDPIPLMILGGSDDIQTPPEALLRMGLGIVGAQFVRVPDAAHMATVDNAEFTISALQRFIAGEPVQERLSKSSRLKR